MVSVGRFAVNLCDGLIVMYFVPCWDAVELEWLYLEYCCLEIEFE